MLTVSATAQAQAAAMRPAAVVCAQPTAHPAVNPGTEKRGQTIDPEIGGFML